jgi:glutamine synthetase
MSGAPGSSIEEASRTIAASGVETVRFGWCDAHGTIRCKTLTVAAALKALRCGVGMVSTLLLKDTADRTAFKVFDAAITAALPGFEYAANVQLLPDPGSFRVLPWADRTGWLRCQPVFADGTTVPYDTRHQLQRALARLAESGWGLVCGLEVELHIYRLHDPVHGVDLDPTQADWPGPAPQVSMLHPGYNLLSEQCVDRAEEPLAILRRTAQALGLPLTSLEIELGPSQFEVVFEATDALTAADNMVLFRSATRQALRRAGYHATFMCRPPFPNIISSGWHLHQSLVSLETGVNVFMPSGVPAVASPDEARHTLSNTGAHYLAGLLHHARGMAVMGTPTANGFGRFRANALAPQSALWGRDNRGAMLRVLGGPGDPATRIENRVGEPAANPYLYMAAQIHAGLAGIAGRFEPGRATESPYADSIADNRLRLPDNLSDALIALEDDEAMREGFGVEFLRWYAQIKLAEHARRVAAPDATEFDRREYFGRI